MNDNTTVSPDLQTGGEDPDMLPEYDFSSGVRGKYAGRMKRTSNIARLAPDIAEAFPTDNELNEALRSLIAERRVTSEQQVAPK